MPIIARRLMLLLISMTLSACTTRATRMDRTAPDSNPELAMSPGLRGETGCRALIGRSFPSASEKLRAVFDFDWNDSVLEDPEWATYVGDPRGQDLLTERSRASIDRRRDLTKCRRDLIRSVDRDSLETDSDRLSYDLFARTIDEALFDQKFPSEFLVVDQMGGPHQWLPQLLLSMRQTGERDYLDRIARLERVPAWLGNYTRLLQEGLAQGITPPRGTLVGVPAQIDLLLQTDGKKNPLMRSFDEMPSSIPTDRAAALRARALDTIRKTVIPAFKNFRTYVADTYIRAAREPIAFGLLPNGVEWYARLIHGHTTTDLKPDEIHRLGLREVERIGRELESAMRASGWSGTREEFFNYLRHDTKFFYRNPQDLVRAYREISKRIDPQLTTLFGKLPRLPYGVRPMQDFASKEGPTAYYEPGSIEGARPGWFIANTYDLKSRPKWEMEALTAHEAVPGHHLQIAIAQELENLPRFRRESMYTAFTEGWGLYAESLGPELGLFKDPYSRVGQLTYEMWRACRLVVDTGIHAKGWSRSRAIEFMASHMPKPRHDIEAEVDRYIVWPGQATAYKVGELKFKELRKKAKDALGEKFDVRSFHDELLSGGALPLDVLEKRIDAWISERLRKPTD